MAYRFETPKGYVKLNETSYDKLMNFHYENGFCILTAFRSEYSLRQNRRRNRELGRELSERGLGYVKITGGFLETIEPDNIHWDEAEQISADDELRRLPVIEESLLVPNYNRNTRKPFDDFEELEDIVIELGERWEQDAVLICPPFSNGRAFYAITNSRNGNVGDIDMQFTNMNLASISDEYFSSLAKTKNILMRKRGEGLGGMKFESKKYICSFVDEPCHTISGKRLEDMSGALPVFGSHYYPTSTLGNKNESKVKDSFNESRIKSPYRKEMDEIDRKFESYIRNRRKNKKS